MGRFRPAIRRSAWRSIPQTSWCSQPRVPALPECVHHQQRRLFDFGSISISAGSGPYGVAVYPLGGAAGGYVYTANSAASTISGFSYDGSGNLTELSTSPYYPSNTGAEGIAIDPKGQYLYVTNYGDSTITTFSIDSQSGALIVMGTGEHRNHQHEQCGPDRGDRRSIRSVRVRGEQPGWIGLSVHGKCRCAHTRQYVRDGQRGGQPTVIDRNRMRRR